MPEEKQNEVLDDLIFIEKPTRKPDRRILGRIEQWEGTDFQQFVPANVGTGPKRTVVKSTGKAKLVKNEGEKDSSYSLLLNEDSKNEFFAEKMLDDTVAVLKPYLKKEVKVPSARFIRDDENIKVWKRKDAKKIALHIELDGTLNKKLLVDEWSKLSYEIVKLLNTEKFF